ncbi:Alpha/Beta hydrolase protein [Halteromyces radiatus]|uniref:Alpha/Beta hydrolase protein n=1 Tax=Halteromyces radiatus TaxID=101107 RepID=UPI00221EF3B6|nr:Alpha/Beta hydrolase protein [Halteromyces radiatus]KAI8097348.1 Alpha/Beta hydrolase protein [Halteromyces radiatus]
MGLSAPCQAWDFQTKFLAATGKYTCILFDNRGNGHSDSPIGLYTTSQLADDALDLLDVFEWKTKVHLVGISMGGMICLEMVDKQVNRFSSLTLTSTSARRFLPTWTAVSTFTKIALLYREPRDQINAVMGLVYPSAWLDQVPSDPAHHQYETNRDMAISTFIRHMGQSRLQPLHGNLAQVSACLRHHFSDARLIKLQQSGLPILVVTGTHDNLVPPASSFHLNRILKPRRFHVFHGSGHDIPEEQTSRYNQILLEHLTFSSTFYPPTSSPTFIAEAKL